MKRTPFSMTSDMEDTVADFAVEFLVDLRYTIKILIKKEGITNVRIGTDQIRSA